VSAVSQRDAPTCTHDYRRRTDHDLDRRLLSRDGRRWFPAADTTRTSGQENVPGRITARSVHAVRISVHLAAGHAVAISDGEHEVTVDDPLPGGDGDLGGMTPLRLLLASLAGCSGSSVAALLRRDGQPVERVEVTARGRRRDEHPTVITDIDLAFVVHGAGANVVGTEQWNGIPANIDQHPERLWDWKDPQFLRWSIPQ
jgi:uncharacterized OsmC-like protein